MEIYQSYRFRLRPTPEQEKLLAKFVAARRMMWNIGLEATQRHYKETGKYLGYFATSARVTQWRRDKATAYLAEIPRRLLTSALSDLDRAYQDFFAKRRGFPQQKPKKKEKSFRVSIEFKLNEDKSLIRLPKIGWVRYYNSRRIMGDVNSVTVLLDAGKWYCVVVARREVQESEHTPAGAVVVSLGAANEHEEDQHKALINFAKLSNGELIEPLDVYSKNKKKIKQLRHKLNRCKSGSANWKETKLRIEKLQRKMFDIRKDFLHKISTGICRNNGVVFIEKCNTNNTKRLIKMFGGMRALTNTIKEQGWAAFTHQLTYKQAWQGGYCLQA